MANIFMKTSVLKLIESNLRIINQSCYYARWSHRRPRKVLTTEEYNNIENKNDVTISTSEEKIIELDMHTNILPQQSKTKWTPKINKPNDIINLEELDKKSDAVHYKIEPKVSKKKKVSYNINKETTKTTDMLETVVDANGNFVYTKLKDNDPSISQLLITVKSRKEQIKKDLALLEGKRLIREALEAQCTLKSLVFSRKNDVEYLKPYLPKSGARLYKMPYREIQLWSDLTTTPGIMGIFKTPEVEKFIPKNSLGLTIICDNIREPGNLGAVLRTAAGVGAQRIFLTKGCVDLWDTKVLRSACGAHFRLQIHKKMDWENIKNKLDTSKPTVLIADNKIVTESISVDQLQNSNESSSSNDEQNSNEIKNLKDIVTSMPLLPYYGVNFNDLGSLVLIVGGETEGISEESYRFAADFNGIRLNIPLNNNIDSLNTGTALGIIMFEVKRQMYLVDYKNKQ
ncbi:hypothetical protein ILUMI_22329 [Ignelater luminosus]|uniref:RNA 2-O ribose methyltransferase substrate binding domain-containing protein n=1 Tax=Ignelater luminosus TaxID=2038154 RepID=A0A8K0FXG4_IGNLU|nr:hypothetical protein ILUMI_22329 [Ignelater luminosus]